MLEDLVSSHVARNVLYLQLVLVMSRTCLTMISVSLLTEGWKNTAKMCCDPGERQGSCTQGCGDVHSSRNNPVGTGQRLAHPVCDIGSPLVGKEQCVYISAFGGSRAQGVA